MSFLIGRDVADLIDRAAHNRATDCPGCAALTSLVAELKARLEARDAADHERRREAALAPHLNLGATR